MKHAGIFVATSLLMALPTLSDPVRDEVRLGQPVYGGNGCPAGSAGLSLAADGSAALIVFDSFSVKVGGPESPSAERKSCNLAIPVHVPAGQSVSIGQAQFKGHVELPARAHAQVHAEYFFAGSRGPVYTQSFRGPKSEDIVVTHNPGPAGAIWSPCGQDVNWRINLSVRVQTNREKDDTFAVLDQGALNQLIIVRPCGGDVPLTPQPPQ